MGGWVGRVAGVEAVLNELLASSIRASYDMRYNSLRVSCSVWASGGAMTAGAMWDANG